MYIKNGQCRYGKECWYQHKEICYKTKRRELYKQKMCIIMMEEYYAEEKIMEAMSVEKNVGLYIHVT